MARRKAQQAVEEGFKHLNKTPYVWGGNSWSGIDCSHFVCKCYDIPYETTHTMVTTDTLRNYGFRPIKYTSADAQFGDILVYDGHTGICAPSLHDKKNPNTKGTIQSYSDHGVGWLIFPGSGGWTRIWRPDEGWGVSINNIIVKHY